jgi:hypothetical protein
MYSYLLAGFVFGMTCIATVIIALANVQAPNAKSLSMSAAPIFIAGCVIAGMLVLSNGTKPW